MTDKAKEAENREEKGYACEICGKTYDLEQAGGVRYICCGHRLNEVGKKKFPPPIGP
jgi:DNA-directed RNA polymerase subunit RPC12/RpoP